MKKIIHGKWRKEIVKLQKGDRFYVEIPEGEDEQYSVLVFKPTPRGGNNIFIQFFEWLIQKRLSK